MEAGDGSTVALEPAAAPYDCCQLEAESGGALGPGREVEQSFVCSSDGVWRVDVQVGTYCRRNHHVVRLRIEDDAGNVLGERALSAAMMLNQSWVSLELDAGRRASAGQCLRIVAEAPGAVPGNEVLLFHASAPALPGYGELRVGGEKLPGRTLAFRSFTEVIT